MDVQSCINLLSETTSSSSVNYGLLFAMIGLLCLSAFFSMSETAFSSVPKSKLTVEVEKRKPGAKKALELTENFERILTTLLIGNNLVNTALSTLALTFFIQLAIFGNLAELFSTIIVTVVLLIFGEICPKMIGKTYPVNVCLKVSWIIYILSIIFYPLVIFFSGIKKIITRNKDNSNSQMDENQLEVIIDEMKDTGAIEEDEAEMIHNTLDLNDKTVEDIMIPRIKMEAIDYNATLEEVKEFMLNNPYSRIPVYKNDKDHVVGILYERDFFPAYVKNKSMSWRKLLKPVKYVSAAMKVDALMEKLQQEKTHIAIVSGEYGEVLGLVTMEDALEELVGEIYDEHDEKQKELVFEQQEDGSYIVDGEYEVDDVFDKLDIDDAPEDAPAKLSGWLYAKCESLPEVGFKTTYLAIYTKQNEETDEYEDHQKLLTFTIHEVKNRSITSVMISIREATDEEVEEYQKEHKED